MEAIVFLVFYLIGMLTLILVTTFVVKKIALLQYGRQGAISLDKKIRLEETLSIDVQKKLCLISVEGEKHLIATSKDQVVYLSKIEGGEKK